MYNKTNSVDEYNIRWPYQPTRTFPNVPAPCQNCPTNPFNSRSGNYNCTLGQQNFD